MYKTIASLRFQYQQLIKEGTYDSTPEEIEAIERGFRLKFNTSFKGVEHPPHLKMLSVDFLDAIKMDGRRDVPVRYLDLHMKVFVLIQQQYFSDVSFYYEFLARFGGLLARKYDIEYRGMISDDVEIVSSFD